MSDEVKEKTPYSWDGISAQRGCKITAILYSKALSYSHHKNDGKWNLNST